MAEEWSGQDWHAGGLRRVQGCTCCDGNRCGRLPGPDNSSVCQAITWGCSVTVVAGTEALCGSIQPGPPRGCLTVASSEWPQQGPQMRWTQHHAPEQAAALLRHQGGADLAEGAWGTEAPLTGASVPGPLTVSQRDFWEPRVTSLLDAPHTRECTRHSWITTWPWECVFTSAGQPDLAGVPVPSHAGSPELCSAALEKLLGCVFLPLWEQFGA